MTTDVGWMTMASRATEDHYSRQGEVLLHRVIIFVFLNFWAEMGSRRGGRGFKRFLEAVGFVLAEFELKRSHGDPIRESFYGFGTCELAQLCLRERYLCLGKTYLCLRATYIEREYIIEYAWNIE